MPDNALFHSLNELAKKEREQLLLEKKRRQERIKMQKELPPKYTDEELESGVQQFVLDARSILNNEWSYQEKSLRRRILAAYVICNQWEEFPILLSNAPAFVNLHEISQIVSESLHFSDLYRHRIACICRQLTEKKLLNKNPQAKIVVGKNSVPYKVPMWRLTPNGYVAHQEHEESERTIFIED